MIDTRDRPLAVHHPHELQAPGARWVVGSLVLCGAVLWSANGSAAGFHIDEQDARATGRGGAVTASTNNPSAVYFNPAGLAQLGGVQVNLGASLVAPRSSFAQDPGGEAASSQEVEADTQRFVLPQIYAGAKLGELVAVGLGFYAPFGLAIRWPEASPGRAVVREAELQAPFLTTAAALDLGRWLPGLALGAGLDVVPSQVLLRRDIPFGSDLGQVALGGSALGIGGRAGLMYRPEFAPVSLGLTWRSPVALDFEGEADFEAPTNYRAALPPDGDVGTKIVLPGSVGLGVAVRPLPAWELEVDYNLRGWSSYDELAIELPGGQSTVSRRDWRNSSTVRAGTEIAFAPTWSARLGFIWDQTPIPQETLDFQLPDANRIDVTAGFGGQIVEGVRADLGGLYVLPQTRDTATTSPLEPSVQGQYEIAAWVVSITLGVRLGVEAAQADPYALRPLGEPAPRQEPVGLEQAKARREVPPGL